MSFIFPPSPTVGLPIVNSQQLFPVRRVYCVGRNYADHAREMGADPEREPPFFFCKANDNQSIVTIKSGEICQLPYPDLTNNYHYELELVVAIGKDGKNITVENAGEHIFGYAIGLDMTRRDLQSQMKQGGKSWEVGKAFDYSAPIGEIYPVEMVTNIDKSKICLVLNDEIKQNSHIDKMIWNINETIAKLSQLFSLKAGDLIFTGTPEGVGAVVKGDKLVGEIDGLGKIELVIV